MASPQARVCSRKKMFAHQEGIEGVYLLHPKVAQRPVPPFFFLRREAIFFFVKSSVE